MLIASSYVCSIKGPASLEAPEPERLGQAARVAKNLGLERLVLPVLEESLLGRTQAKVRFFDRLIETLDLLDNAGLSAWLIAPARRVLGLDWVPPYLVKAVRDPRAGRAFLEGRLRNLCPYNWWNDLSILEKRIRAFRELVSALSCHPALTGWIVMDRALEWPRPYPEVADLVLKSYTAEIRERDEKVTIYMGLGWSELLDPRMAQSLVPQVDGVRISGLESIPRDMNIAAGLTGELWLASYLGTLSRWIFRRPVDIEVGWGLLDQGGDLEETVAAGRRLAMQGLGSVTWLNLTDPLPGLYGHPPWGLEPRLEQVGLLDHGLEPKQWVESLLLEIRKTENRDESENFIDLSRKEYINDPETHFSRLWDHFVETFL
ncbi:MAG: hypothetical protein SV686_03345 [Thermodesulfobacteriota bacterium]|nr:hypothetical protein [Thermodesulfobacteriota bacterium]